MMQSSLFDLEVPIDQREETRARYMSRGALIASQRKGVASIPYDALAHIDDEAKYGRLGIRLEWTEKADQEIRRQLARDGISIPLNVRPILAKDGKTRRAAPQGYVIILPPPPGISLPAKPVMDESGNPVKDSLGRIKLSSWSLALSLAKAGYAWRGIESAPRYESAFGKTYEETESLFDSGLEFRFISAELAQQIPMAVTYFVKNRDGELKIGHTTNLKQRLKDGKTFNPAELTVVAVIEGVNAETILHKRFDHLLIPGNREWFYPTKELLDFIEQGTSRSIKE